MINELDKALFTTSETASYLGICKNTLYAWTRQNILPKPLEVNGRMRFRISDIRHWLETGCPRLHTYQPTEPKKG